MFSACCVIFCKMLILTIILTIHSGTQLIDGFDPNLYFILSGTRTHFVSSLFPIFINNHSTLLHTHTQDNIFHCTCINNFLLVEGTYYSNGGGGDLNEVQHGNYVLHACKSLGILFNYFS